MTDKTPLILLPGLLCDAHLWAAQCDALADIADCRVVILNQDDNMTAMAERVLGAAPARFAVAGLSMGGYCAQEIMRLAPERVTRLGLLDTSAGADLPERSATRREWVAYAQQSDAAFDEIIERHVPMYLPPERLSDTALVEAVRASARNIGVEAYARQQAAIAGRRDQHDTLAAITCPTLVLCGHQDAATTPAMHEDLARAIGAAAHLEMIDDCAHLSTLERPDAVSAAMRRWLLEDQA